MSALLPALGCGTNRFAPIGPEVRLRAALSRSAKTSAVRYPAATKPSPPAFVPAAASSGVDGPPAIGATRIGAERSRKSNAIGPSYHGPNGPPSSDRLAEEQAVLRLLADVRQYRVTGHPAFEGEPAACQHRRGAGVVDVAVRRHPVHSRVALGLSEQQLHRLGHQPLPPPPPTEAIAEFDGVWPRTSPSAQPDRA